MALGEVAKIDKLAIDPRQLVYRPAQVEIARRIALQELVTLRIEESAVEGGDVERRVAGVDVAKEIAQACPIGAGHGQDQAFFQFACHIFLNGIEAVAAAIHLVVLQGQQVAGLGIEDEEQAIEQDQRIVVD